MNRILCKRGVVSSKTLRLNGIKRAFGYTLTAKEEEKWWFYADQISWTKKPEILLQENKHTGLAEWFPDGELNLSYNCLDRHMEDIGGEWALTYDSAMSTKSGFLTYKQLLRKTNTYAAVFDKMGIRKGDKVMIFLPDLSYNIITNLALWRIGAIPIPINCKHSEKILSEKLDIYKPKLIVTASCAVEGDHISNIKSVVDRARALSNVNELQCLVFQRDYKKAKRMIKGVDFEFDEVVESLTVKEIAPVPVSSIHPSYIFHHESLQRLHDGVVRNTGGNAVGLVAALTSNYGLKKGNTMMAMGHLCWAFGMNYKIIAPLLLGMKTVVTENFTYEPEECWNIMSKNSVDIFIASAARFNIIGKREDGTFPGDSLKGESLKHIVAYNGTIDQEIVKNLHENRKNIRFSSSIFNKYLGVCMTGNPTSDITELGKETSPYFGVKLAYTEDNYSNSDDLFKRIALRPPYHPCFMTDFVGENNSVKELFDHEGNFLTEYEGHITEKGNLLINYDTKHDTMSKKGFEHIEMCDVEYTISMMKEIEKVYILLKPQEKKGLCPVVLVSAQKGLDQEEIRAKIVAQVKEHIGEVVQLLDVIVLQNVGEDYDWETAEQIYLGTVELTESLRDKHQELLSKLN